MRAQASAVGAVGSLQAKHFFQVSSSFVYDVILSERKFVVKQGAHVTSYTEIKILWTRILMIRSREKSQRERERDERRERERERERET